MTTLAMPAAPAATPPANKPAELRVSTPTRIYQPDRLTLDEMFRIANGIARAELSTSNPQTLLAKILFGQEIGIGSMQAIQAIHIIEGKPTLDASFIAAKIKASPKYDYQILAHDDMHCEISFSQNAKLLGTSSFTVADAERAKLFGKKSAIWEKYPRNMTFSRAMTNGQAWFCGDVMGGRINTPEEMGALVTIDDNGVQHVVVGSEGAPLLDSPNGAIDTISGEVVRQEPSNVVQIDPRLIELRQEALEKRIAIDRITTVLRGFGVERMSALPPGRIDAFRRALFGATTTPRNVTPAAASPGSARTAGPPATERPATPQANRGSDDARLRHVAADRIHELALPPEIVTKMIIECSEGKARAIDDPKLKPDVLFRLEARLKSLQTNPAPAATVTEPSDRIATLRQYALDHNLRDRVQGMLADLHVKTLADIPASELDAFERKLRASGPASAAGDDTAENRNAGTSALDP